MGPCLSTPLGAGSLHLDSMREREVRERARASIAPDPPSDSTSDSDATPNNTKSDVRKSD